MPYDRGLKSDITTSQNLASGALDYTTSIGRRFKLVEISFKFSGNVTETITITRDSRQGANYDIVLLTRTITDEDNFIYIPSNGELYFQNDDEIRVQCTNSGAANTVYVVLKTLEVLL